MKRQITDIKGYLTRNNEIKYLVYYGISEWSYSRLEHIIVGVYLG